MKRCPECGNTTVHADGCPATPEPITKASAVLELEAQERAMRRFRAVGPRMGTVAILLGLVFIWSSCCSCGGYVLGRWVHG